MQTNIDVATQVAAHAIPDIRPMPISTRPENCPTAAAFQLHKRLRNAEHAVDPTGADALEDAKEVARQQVIQSRAVSLSGALAKLSVAFGDFQIIVADYIDRESHGYYEPDPYIRTVTKCLYDAVSAIETAGGLNRDSVGIYMFPRDQDPSCGNPSPHQITGIGAVLRSDKNEVQVGRPRG